MAKITFECIDQRGEAFSVVMMSDSESVKEVVGATVAAYREHGIEVISAARMEEIEVDMELFARPAEKVAPAKGFTAWLRAKPMQIVGHLSGIGGFVLAIVGFDNGFSVANLMRHVSAIVPAISHFAHLA